MPPPVVEISVWREAGFRRRSTLPRRGGAARPEPIPEPSDQPVKPPPAEVDTLAGDEEEGPRDNGVRAEATLIPTQISQPSLVHNNENYEVIKLQV
jgi:hypothetical protein